MVDGKELDLLVLLDVLPRVGVVLLVPDDCSRRKFGRELGEELNGARRLCSFEWEIGRTSEWGEGERWVVSSFDARMRRKGQQGESRRTLGSSGESGHVPGGTSDGTDDWRGARKRVT